jgi:RNA recognition motif-containing protein
MTNEQLALALINAFRHFGPIVSVKASRDARGRPFGFVEFSHPACAQDALAAAPFININFRQVRVEQAKCQRKLGIRMRIPAGSAEDSLIPAHLKSMRAMMLEYVEEGGLKMNIFKTQSLGDPHQLDTVISAVLKFNDSRAADHAYQV